MLENVCRGFGGGRNAVLEVCENEGGEADEVDSLVDKGCVEMKGLFYRENGVPQ